MAITRLLSPWRGPNVKRFSACIARFCSGIWELEVSLPFLARAICAHSADATTANASAGGSCWNLERMGEGLARYLFSGALKQPTIINPNLGKSCWRGGYASRNFGGSGAKRQLRTCLEQPMLARDTLGGARSLQQELVRRRGPAAASEGAPHSVWHSGHR